MWKQLILVLGFSFSECKVARELEIIFSNVEFDDIFDLLVLDNFVVACYLGNFFAGTN
jgi:hypothetical protein